MSPDRFEHAKAWLEERGDPLAENEARLIAEAVAHGLHIQLTDLVVPRVETAVPKPGATPTTLCLGETGTWLSAGDSAPIEGGFSLLNPDDKAYIRAGSIDHETAKALEEAGYDRLG